MGGMNNRKQDRARCLKINAIRAAARGVSLEALQAAPCPTCTRRRNDPYFRADARGHGVEGCVDAHHEGAGMVGERAMWFSRPAAQAIRAVELARIAR